MLEKIATVLTTAAIIAILVLAWLAMGWGSPCDTGSSSTGCAQQAAPGPGGR